MNDQQRVRANQKGSHLRPSASICCLLLLAGCNGYGGPRSVVNDDPTIKIPEIKSAVAHNDRNAMRQFVTDLDSDDAAVRFYAIQGLRRMTGQTFDYDWIEADRHARAPAIARWQAYLDSTRPATRRAVAAAKEPS